MKEATGEGSMTIVTIIIIVALAAAAAVVVAAMTGKAKDQADDISTNSVEACPEGYTWDSTKNKCNKNG